ncbi:MAG: hypothetical protein GX130_05920 [Candidatus Hydrogenedens sp.]|jgi:hypothetical protein|nr:hypothetical protein [Candidatus Hydrogenedens sp.]
MPSYILCASRHTPRRHSGFFATRHPHQSIQPQQRKKDRDPDWEDEEKHNLLSSAFCVAFALLYLLDTVRKPSGIYLGTPISTLAGHPGIDHDLFMHLTGEQRLRVYKGFHLISGQRKTCCRIIVYKKIDAITRCLPMWKLAFPGAQLKVISPIPYHLYSSAGIPIFYLFVLPRDKFACCVFRG